MNAVIDELPSHAEIFRAIIGELYDDLPGRVDRLRLLAALDQDFGGTGVILPGGHVTWTAYMEARSAFTSGQFLAVILLSQTLIENLLGSHLHLDEMSRAIHEDDPFRKSTIPRRPSMDWILKECLRLKTISDDEHLSIKRIQGIRNPLIHYRSMKDPSNLGRRALDYRTHELFILAQDARFAITTVIKLLAKPEFSYDRQPSDS